MNTKALRSIKRMLNEGISPEILVLTTPCNVDWDGEGTVYVCPKKGLPCRFVATNHDELYVVTPTTRCAAILAAQQIHDFLTS